MRRPRSFVPLLLPLMLALGTPWAGEGQEQEVTAHASRAEVDGFIDNEPKIRFDMERLDADGLHGPPDGLRALHYEYCIPHRGYVVDEVARIDPTLNIQQDSPGRIGCGQGELLCLGHTHQPGYRAVLEQLAALPMVREIREAFFE